MRAGRGVNRGVPILQTACGIRVVKSREREELKKQQTLIIYLDLWMFGIPDLNLTLGKGKWERTEILPLLRSVPGFRST